MVDCRGVVERYFANMRARDLEGLVKLFAPEAMFILPDGRELSGYRRHS